MKFKLLSLLFIMLLISCKKKIEKDVIANKTDKHIIKAYLTNNSSKTAYLFEKKIDSKFKLINRTKIKNNYFEFSKLADNESIVYVSLDNQEIKIPLISNNFETIINVENDLKSAKIIGSPLQEKFTNYLNGLKVAKNKFVYQLNTIKENKDNVFSSIVLKEMLGKTKWRLGQNKKAFENLNKTIKNSENGKEILRFITKYEPLVKDKVEIIELSLNPEVANTEPVKEPIKVTKKPTFNRKKATNFYAESFQGSDISLNQVRKNAKVTLIDFWASWCRPCRKSNPQLKRLYQKYKSKGFQIISVSVDRYEDKQKWKNTIANDGLTWTQVIDDNSRIANMYHVTSVPYTILLDKNGGIISTKNSTYTIEQKLKEILK